MRIQFSFWRIVGATLGSLVTVGISGAIATRVVDDTAAEAKVSLSVFGLAKFLLVTHWFASLGWFLLVVVVALAVMTAWADKHASPSGRSRR